MRDRFLFRADVEGFTYHDVLEIKAGRVRLIRTSDRMRRRQRRELLLIAAAWLVANSVVYLGLRAALPVPAWPDWFASAGTGTIWFLGLISTTILWERHGLRVFADRGDPTELKVVETTSFRTFQEIRASTPHGEIRITVQGSQTRLGRALKLAAIPVASTA